MKWDLNAIESKLNKISNDSKNEDEKMKKTIQEIATKDDTKQSYEFLSDEEREYQLTNDAYKEYISQYSQAYIEMSEYYYGPELPYDVYCKEFKIKKKEKKEETYLDSPKDIKELYALFMFYSLFDISVGKVINPG